MQKHSSNRTIPTLLKTLLASLALASATSNAAVYGILGNFDVVNDTNQTAHGFEIDLEGLHAADVTDVFGGPGRGFPDGRGFDPSTSVERYGAPTITEYANGAIFGTKVTYYGNYASSIWDYGTPSTQQVGQFVTPGDNCWSGGGLGYGANTPCDHFGVGTSANPTKTTYSWLFDNGSGQLSNTNGVVSLPTPNWQVLPAPAGQPPIVVAQIQAPAPLPDPNEPQWGDAIWVKVFTTELPDPVKLEDLVGGNPKVDQAVTETEWQLLQVDPGDPASGVLESGYGAPVGPNAASILRRYEFYKFGGQYDAVDHHAILQGNDSNPLGSDLGAYVGAQNAGVNLLNVAAAPEPSAYAMILAGLGMVGLVVVRRKR
jgi:hypothetical protein